MADAATGAVTVTGLNASRLINDAQLAASRDGSVLVFRRSSSVLVIAAQKDGLWEETLLEGPQIRNPDISADGQLVVYQARGTSVSQIYVHDRQTGSSRLISQNAEGAEADAACVSPSISSNGARVTFISAASNLAANGNGQAQVYIGRLEQEVPPVVLTLHKGWNLCALSFEPNEESIALLNEEGPCWGWKNGQFVPLKAFMPGHGFWLHASCDRQLQLKGSAASPMPLQQGWNLVLPSLYPEIPPQNLFLLEAQIFTRQDNATNHPAWIFVK